MGVQLNTPFPSVVKKLRLDPLEVGQVYVLLFKVVLPVITNPVDSDVPLIDPLNVIVSMSKLVIFSISDSMVASVIITSDPQIKLLPSLYNFLLLELSKSLIDECISKIPLVVI